MAHDLINPLVKLVQERLPWLFSDQGFKVVEYSYDARAFGNCLAVLESPTMRLRFTRDRGITSAELAARSDPETWYNAGSLLSFLHGEPPDAAFEGLAVLLQRHWSELENALGSDLAETKKREMLRRDQVAKYLRDHRRLP